MLHPSHYHLFFWPVFLAATLLHGQSAHRDLRSGDKAYRNGAFEKAENNYRQAAESQPDAQSHYNLGNALYQQKKYDAAATAYEKAARAAPDADTRARALHNLGNAHYQQKQLDKAIEAYKAALRNSPGDADTARNLALAQRESGEQSQPGTSNPKPGTGEQSQPGIS
ncbi:MAG TPA: tetratricopeptide repeat protein, partial [Saprospiraceae bacterium]|nr:tetratricopeptide repeat protein [Saprospiraceae bacterium]